MFLLKNEEVILNIVVIVGIFSTKIVGESNEENYDGRDRSNEFIGDTNSYYVSSSSDEELNENSQRYLTESIPGEPNTDYPTYKSIPKTAFSCKGKPNWGYYADVETGCQVFHVCESDYSKISFMCPIGSIFNQRHLVCDWWYNFECNDVIDLFTFDQVFNEQLSNSEVPFEDSIASTDLNIASSGGNTPQSNSNSISTTTVHNRPIKRKQIKDNRS